MRFFKRIYIINKKAFTFLELIIVIIIIGLVYSIAISNLKNSQKTQKINLEDLRESLLKYQKNSQKLQYTIYGKECENSRLIINGSQDSNQSLILDRDKDMEVFKTDRYGELRKIEYPNEIIDKKEQKVCLKYTLYPNSSGSSYIVFYKNRYYVFHPYFEKTKIFDEKEEALKNFLHNELYPKGSDDYQKE